MAKTQISDVIVPEVFQKYVQERTAEKSLFWTSGVVERSAEFDALANEGGRTVNMPFWQDLSGEEEVLSDTGSLTPAKIAASKDVAAMLQRGKAWSTNDLAGILAGSDPMGAIVDRVGAYWDRRMQACLNSTLKGVFAAANMADSILNIASSGTPNSSNFLTAATFIDATQKLGDAKSSLVAVAMHSLTEAALLKMDLIDYVPDSTGKLALKKFMGLDVIVDDGMPYETISGNVAFTTYLFGRGAIGYGEQTKAMPIEGGHGDWYVEWGRVPLASDTVLINRRRFMLHPRGVRWLDASVAGVSATNAERELQANWTRVYERKNVRIVKVVHNNLA